MTAHSDQAAMPVVRDAADFDGQSGVLLERLVFNHRVEVGAGTADVAAVVADALRAPVERLAKSLLER